MLVVNTKSRSELDIDFGAKLLEKKQKLKTPSKVLEQLVTFGGLGKLTKAPGTIGTLGGIPMVFMLSLWLSPESYLMVTFLFCLASVFIIERYEKLTHEHDLSKIVLDEVVGFMVAMAWLPLSWQSFLAAFVIFRFLDIIKPFPIGLLDKKVKGGLGVVVDDIAAGIITNLILQVVYTETSWLGVQWM